MAAAVARVCLLPILFLGGYPVCGAWGIEILTTLFYCISPPPPPPGSVGSVQAGGGGWLTSFCSVPFFLPPPPSSQPVSNLMDFRWQYPKAEKRALILDMYILPPLIMKQIAAQYEWYISTLLIVQVAVGLCRPYRLLNLWSLEHNFITIGWSTSGTFLHINIDLDRTILSGFFLGGWGRG